MLSTPLGKVLPRRLFVSAALLSSAIASLPFVFTDASNPQQELNQTLSLLHMAAMAILLVLLKRGYSFTVLARCMLAWFFINSTIHIMGQSSFFNPYYGWSGVLVAFAALLLGFRSGLVVGVLVAVQLLVFLNSKRTLQPPFPFIVQHDLFITTLICTLVSAQILMGVLAYCFEIQREQSDERLERQRFAAIRLARLIEVNELFQSTSRQLQPSLNTLDNALARLRLFDRRLTFLPADEQHQLQRLKTSLQGVSAALKNVESYSQTPFEEANQHISMLELFQKLHESVQNEVRLHQVQIRFADQTHNASVHCRPHQILQTMRALITNSIEALEGQNRKRLSVTSSLDQTHLLISVRDNGPGVSRKAEDMLFRPFVSTKQNDRTRGLGLCMGQRIMEEHGGSLQYLPDKETCFVLKFPQHSQEES